MERGLEAYRGSYQNTMEWTSGTKWISCAPGYKTCPELWLAEKCGELCIVQPQKRQMVSLKVKNGKQALALLKALENW